MYKYPYVFRYVVAFVYTRFDKSLEDFHYFNPPICRSSSDFELSLRQLFCNCRDSTAFRASRSLGSGRRALNQINRSRMLDFSANHCGTVCLHLAPRWRTLHHVFFVGLPPRIRGTLHTPRALPEHKPHLVLWEKSADIWGDSFLRLDDR